MGRKWKKRIAIGLACLGVLAVGGVAAGRYAQGSALRGFTDGRLEAADYWDDEPSILSAGLGFDNIIGLPELTKKTVRGAGGA
jgi:hypothetical protein